MSRQLQLSLFMIRVIGLVKDCLEDDKTIFPSILVEPLRTSNVIPIQPLHIIPIELETVEQRLALQNFATEIYTKHNPQFMAVIYVEELVTIEDFATIKDLVRDPDDLDVSSQPDFRQALVIQSTDGRVASGLKLPVRLTRTTSGVDIKFGEPVFYPPVGQELSSIFSKIIMMNLSKIDKAILCTTCNGWGYRLFEGGKLLIGKAKICPDCKAEGTRTP